MIFVDTADLTIIKKFLNYPFISGVTTNPLILQEIPPTDRINHLKTIYHLLAPHQIIMVQATGLTSETIIQDARSIRKALPQAVIKIQADEIGFNAANELIKENIDITFTAVYSATQGIFGGAAGARFVAPYINRMKEAGLDPWKEIKLITESFKLHHTPCIVLAASLRTPEDVAQALSMGCAITAKPSVLEACLTNEPTTKAIQAFNQAAKLI